MSLVFEALNVTFHLVAQVEFFCKSLFKMLAVSLGSDPVANKQVSSAKIKMSLSMSSVMSFMYIKKAVAQALSLEAHQL